MRNHVLVVGLCAVGIAGCGGGGGLPGGNAGATLSAAPNPATYGSPVTLSWGTTRAIRIEESNFGLGASDLNGTLTDNPGIDTTYTFTARVQNEGHSPFEITRTATVTVVKSSKSVLIVGDAAVSGPNQVKDSLETVTTGSVSVSATLPNTLAQDVVVLHPSANLSTADRSKVEAVLSAGKAVVFVGGSVPKVAGGNNVSSLGGMLAGATSFDSFVGAQYSPEFRTIDGAVRLSVVHRGRLLGGTAALLNVSTSADRVLASRTGQWTHAMAYRVPTGGKTGFIGHDGVGSDDSAKGFDVALRCIVRWCMDGS